MTHLYLISYVTDLGDVNVAYENMVLAVHAMADLIDMGLAVTMRKIEVRK